LFKQNNYKTNEQLFTAEDLYDDKISKLLKNSWAISFREHVFSKINEENFKYLFKDHDSSRPNKPINILIGLEIIKEIFDYTDDELIEQFHLNLSIIVALGLNKIGELSLGERTLYNFRNRILEYENLTGENLYEKEFKLHRDYLIKKFDIETDQQRTDSFLVGSNIRKMSRIELITKMIQLLYEELPDDGKNEIKNDLKMFLGDDPYRLIYKKKKAEIEKMLEEGLKQLALLLNKLEKNDTPLLETGKRLLNEQGTQVDDEEWRLKDSKEIKADSIQSLNDLEATYRKKGKKECRGYVSNIVETANKENELQIITDVSVDKSIVDDGKHMASRLDSLRKETRIKDLIGDGGYDTDELREKCNQVENPVELITTGIKGGDLDNETLTSLDFKIEENEIISCPAGISPSEQRYNAKEKKIVAKFDKETCSKCQYNNICPGNRQKKYYNIVISKKKIATDIKRYRLNNDKDYRSKCCLRPAVESTVWQFNKDLNRGKVRFRGKVKIRARMLLKGIGINFKRVMKREKKKICTVIFCIISQIYMMLRKNICFNCKKSTFCS
jgi:hypothetical protein